MFKHTVNDVKKMSVDDLRELFVKCEKRRGFAFDIKAIYEALHKHGISPKAKKLLDHGIKADDVSIDDLLDLATIELVKLMQYTNWPIERAVTFQRDCMHTARQGAVHQDLYKLLAQANAKN